MQVNSDTQVAIEINHYMRNGNPHKKTNGGMRPHQWDNPPKCLRAIEILVYN